MGKQKRIAKSRTKGPAPKAEGASDNVAGGVCGGDEELTPRGWHLRLIASKAFLERANSTDESFNKLLDDTGTDDVAAGYHLPLAEGSQLLNPLLVWFREGSDADAAAELVFPAHLNKKQRANIHRMTTHVGLGALESFSRGLGSGRYISVMRQGSAPKRDLSDTQRHKAEHLWRWACESGFKVSKDEVADMVFTDMLPADLVQLWAVKASQQKALVALCEAVTSGDVITVKEAASTTGGRDVLQAGMSDVMEGCIPLHMAAAKGDVELVAALLEAGAKLNAVDSHNDTALDLARRHDCSDAEGVLLRAGAEDPTADNFPGGKATAAVGSVLDPSAPVFRPAGFSAATAGSVGAQHQEPKRNSSPSGSSSSSGSEVSEAARSAAVTSAARAAKLTAGGCCSPAGRNVGALPFTSSVKSRHPFAQDPPEVTTMPSVDKGAPLVPHQDTAISKKAAEVSGKGTFVSEKSRHAFAHDNVEFSINASEGNMTSDKGAHVAGKAAAAPQKAAVSSGKGSEQSGRDADPSSNGIVSPTKDGDPSVKSDKNSALSHASDKAASLSDKESVLFGKATSTPQPAAAVSDVVSDQASHQTSEDGAKKSDKHTLASDKKAKLSSESTASSHKDVAQSDAPQGGCNAASSTKDAHSALSTQSGSPRVMSDRQSGASTNAPYGTVSLASAVEPPAPGQVSMAGQAAKDAADSAAARSRPHGGGRESLEMAPLSAAAAVVKRDYSAAHPRAAFAFEPAAPQEPPPPSQQQQLLPTAFDSLGSSEAGGGGATTAMTSDDDDCADSYPAAAARPGGSAAPAPSSTHSLTHTPPTGSSRPWADSWQQQQQQDKEEGGRLEQAGESSTPAPAGNAKSRQLTLTHRSGSGASECDGDRESFEFARRNSVESLESTHLGTVPSASTVAVHNLGVMMKEPNMLHGSNPEDSGGSSSPTKSAASSISLSDMGPSEFALGVGAQHRQTSSWQDAVQHMPSLPPKAAKRRSESNSGSRGAAKARPGVTSTETGRSCSSASSRLAAAQRNTGRSHGAVAGCGKDSSPVVEESRHHQTAGSLDVGKECLKGEEEMGPSEDATCANGSPPSDASSLVAWRVWANNNALALCGIGGVAVACLAAAVAVARPRRR